VYAEIITAPTHAGQLEMDEFLALMRGYGFGLFNFYDLSAAADGRLPQPDAIFVRAGRAG
jgi:hypothetical protein